jgi:hypothetical protein
MDHWVRGMGEGFDWDMVLSTLEEAADPPTAQEDGRGTDEPGADADRADGAPEAAGAGTPGG